MPTTRLSRSIPFWVLVGGSVVATAGGAYLLFSKLTSMTTTLTDGTATSADVYVGQIWAVAGAIIAGAGLVGLALALTLGALRSLAAPAVDVLEVIEPPAWEEDVVVTETAAYAPASAEVSADEVAATAEPTVTASEPVSTEATSDDAPATETPRA